MNLKRGALLLFIGLLLYVDRKLGCRAEIVNRIAMEIIAVSGGSSRQSARFQSAETTVPAGEDRTPYG
jgi:hypothetical protein